MEVKEVTRLRVRSLITLLVVAGLLAVFAQPAAASPGAFQILVAKAEDGGSCVGDNGLETQLATMPGVTKIDVFNASAGTPTVAQLDPYDLVVAMSDCDAFADDSTFGDNLATYADHGGVVVQYAYTMLNSSDYQLAGRWLSGGYSPYVPGNNVNNDVSLGTFDASSPLMAGVNTLTSTGCNTDPTLAPGATRIARWNNSQEAIALKGQAVAVTAAVDDSACGWSGDYAQLTLNAAKLLDKHLPEGTAIDTAQIKKKKHKARFLFSAPGTITGFECALSRSKTKKKKGKKSAVSFSACSSPKVYKHLKPGRYTFQVRARNANGPDATPASRSFKI